MDFGGALSNDGVSRVDVSDSQILEMPTLAEDEKILEVWMLVYPDFVSPGLGQADCLSENGRKQIRIIKKTFSKTKFDKVFVADEPRGAVISQLLEMAFASSAQIVARQRPEEDWDAGMATRCRYFSASLIKEYLLQDGGDCCFFSNEDSGTFNKSCINCEGDISTDAVLSFMKFEEDALREEPLSDNIQEASTAPDSQESVTSITALETTDDSNAVKQRRKRRTRARRRTVRNSAAEAESRRDKADAPLPPEPPSRETSTGLSLHSIMQSLGCCTGRMSGGIQLPDTSSNRRIQLCFEKSDAPHGIQGGEGREGRNPRHPVESAGRGGADETVSLFAVTVDSHLERLSRLQKRQCQSGTEAATNLRRILVVADAEIIRAILKNSLERHFGNSMKSASISVLSVHPKLITSTRAGQCGQFLDTWADTFRESYVEANSLEGEDLAELSCNLTSELQKNDRQHLWPKCSLNAAFAHRYLSKTLSWLQVFNDVAYLCK